jgi:hypothetical protein
MKGQTRLQYIAFLRQCYQNFSKEDRTRVLDEITRNLQIHRKSAVRLLRGTAGARSRRGRRSIYDESVRRHLTHLWRRMGYPCGKRLQAALPLWIDHYAIDDVLADAEKTKLLAMSASTMDRVLRPFKAEIRRRRMTGTSPYRRMKKLVPLKTLDWNVTDPGHVEADTVAHCGSSMSGVFMWTLTVTDVKTGWTENRMMWGKSGFGVSSAMQDIEEILPFRLKSFSVDNGSEFLNDQMLNYFRDRVKVQRGRPYRKNDQAYVEQKNWTHVRELLGYERFEEKDGLAIINDLYKNDWSALQNMFMPQMKLIRKTRIGAKYVREYSKPETPLDRLIKEASITEETKQRLIKLRSQLNPFEIKARLERKLKEFDRSQKNSSNEPKAA